jgi:RNA-directed DNA polymerase
MHIISFHNIRNLLDLSKNLSISESDLDRLLKCNPQSILYHKMLIPKKSLKYSGVRTVYKVVNPTLSLLQKNLETSINHTVEFPPYVQGFVKNQSIVTNAKKHLGRKLLLNADIKNFFESIRIEAVISAFQYLGCSVEIAEKLARLCTLDGFLAQGLSTSPVLANVVSMDMDKELLSLSKHYNCVFTRYSDDITMSGDDDVPSKAELDEILKKSGFQLNHVKFKVKKKGQKQYVTGLTVFDEKYPRIPKRIKKWLRLNLFYINKYGFESHVCKILNIDRQDLENDEMKREEVYDYCYKFNKELKGWIDYINSVEPKLAIKFYEQYNLIIEQERRNRASDPINADHGRPKELHLPRILHHKLSNDGRFKSK